MAIKKRQVIIATMVLALGVAVYLNWQFTGEKELKTTDTLETVKELGESRFVNNPTGITSSEAGEEVDISSSDAADTTDTAETAEANVSTTSQYFAEVRMARQKARDEAVKLLSEIVENLESSDKAKTEAVDQAAEIAKNMEKEVSMEGIIKAKGFADCMVHIQDDSCNVVVQAEELLPSDAITIRDVVNSQGGIAYENIKIVNIK